MEKTNVMRILDQHKITYQSYYYGDTSAISGVEVATVLNQDYRQVFKTLVTVSHSKKNYVFMIPVAENLDLKKAAKSVGEKSVSMLPSKELLSLTGYIHGGCSPIGMVKDYKVTIDSSALNYDKIYLSGGRVGLQIKLKLGDLEEIIHCNFADISN